MKGARIMSDLRTTTRNSSVQLARRRLVARRRVLLDSPERLAEAPAIARRQVTGAVNPARKRCLRRAHEARRARMRPPRIAREHQLAAPLTH